MSVLTFGETMALTTAQDPGPLAHVSTMRLGIGGAETNFAIALRRLGVPVTWVGRVGSDSLGDRVARELHAERLDAHVVRDPDAPTGLMVKERRTSTSTRVWYYRAGSAGSRFRIGDIPETLWDGVRALHVTGITPALSDTACKATLFYVERARERGIAVSFDLNYRRALWTRTEAAPVYRQIIEQADIVFAGTEEAAIAVGDGTASELAERLCELGTDEAVIKLGDRGALVRARGTEYVCTAVPVDVVDSVGAGDGFVAGYLSERLVDAPIDQRLRTATTVGAFACTVPGDWEGMPRRDELDLLTSEEAVTR
ncbi:sugar kinase [Rhodococcus sp. 15-725-2-2b]|uniref:sugar kinase n=1 Tax=unclassified Rhodococcus (in: high G+C Gram-positive bacteria) TaxID=192944 RepID=UPI000B9C6AA7|nr:MULTISPECIES: sugar kinase [unclassified Rhodococcus (in: high G+C Gram-positive bacteria)]OZC64672.1 sugar kinase [Rhodococcus sp. 06-469-3-2]OZD43490.1 sugar kinase [Rhodococcus sp. 06-1477-1A]OZE13415.1 sugar kinase [Rhodococcus sp. 05-2255-3C]OZE15971.1 sugar kinase [Rhodococcus sp. 05-2255-3B1]OZE19011.1 sugar kinase [Rhodococcus sp. 05-2255-2A2]